MGEVKAFYKNEGGKIIQVKTVEGNNVIFDLEGTEKMLSSSNFFSFIETYKFKETNIKSNSMQSLIESGKPVEEIINRLTEGINSNINRWKPKIEDYFSRKATGMNSPWIPIKILEKGDSYIIVLVSEDDKSKSTKVLDSIENINVVDSFTGDRSDLFTQKGYKLIWEE